MSRGADVVVARRQPVPRTGAYDLYWATAAERHAILERRYSGAPSPWTADPIFATWKFCNLYRAADRVSQALIHDVCYSGEDWDPADQLFAVTAFRLFSRIETWQAVRDYLGRSPRLADLAAGSFTAALEAAAARNGTLYTGAFIVPPTRAYGYDRKYLNLVALLQHMFLRDHLAAALLAAPSLREVYLLLHQYPLMGPFLSYQVTVDLAYTPLIDFSENDFTQPGPGALHGLKKIFEDPGDYSPADLIFWLTDRQADEFARLGLPFAGLWGRPMHAPDAQNWCCETDKYCRKALPDLRIGRQHIKTRFAPSPEPLPALCFPPRWGINIPPLPGPAPRPAPVQAALFGPPLTASDEEPSRR